MSDSRQSLVVERAEQLWQPGNRRSFLRLLGLGGTVVLLPSVFSACSDSATGPGTVTSATLDLTTDAGILNYAFALEQLEAAFYIAVVGSTAFSTMTAEQKEVFTDLRNHEVIHREFLRSALGSAAIGNLLFNSATIATATANTTTILQNAEGFEDLGVAAYNGAGKYLQSAAYLTLAGKIVSVEARHAASIRDMRDALGVTGGTAAGTRFAGDDVVDASTGLDVKLEPSAVLTRVGASATLTSTISVTGPTSKPGTTDSGPPNPTP